MQHAILITAYKNFDQLAGLIDAFDASFRCYIHIDKKCTFTSQEFDLLSEKENVDFIVRHFNVYWGGSNHLYAILQLLNEAYKDPSNHYFHLITGQDYPIKRLKDIDSFFQKNEGKEFLEYNKMPYDKWEHGGLERLEYHNYCDHFNRKSAWGKFWIRILLEFQKTFRIKRKFYEGFPALYGGSTYWSLSRNCVDYVEKYILQNPQYLDRFNNSFCGEEIFFQTLIMNSPFKDNVVNDPLRYIVWENRNGNFPANLDLTDEDSMMQSQAIFARKFEPPVSDELLNNIKKKIEK